MKKILLSLAILSFLCGTARASCLDAYHDAAVKKDKRQDAIVTGVFLVGTLPAGGYWAAVSKVALLAFEVGDVAMAGAIEADGLGHKFLPNKFENMEKLLKGDKEQNDKLKENVKNAYLRDLTKAIVKGKLPRDTQPLSDAELDAFIADGIKEGDESGTLCAPIEGTKMHELYSEAALKDVLVYGLLKEEHGIDHMGVNFIGHEVKYGLINAGETALHKTEEAFVKVGQKIKKIFKHKKKDAPAALDNAPDDSTTLK